MSMSCESTPADNSPMETFHSTLKSESFTSTVSIAQNEHVIQKRKHYILLEYPYSNEAEKEITSLVPTFGALF